LCVTVATLGTGAAYHPFRGQSSILLEAGSTRILVDAGCSALRGLLRLGVPPESLDAILLTHFHADHVCGYPLLLFAASYRLDRVETLTLVPPGESSRVAWLSSSIRGGAPIEPRVVEAQRTTSIGDFTVDPVEVDHGVPASGYMLRYGDLGVLVTGDTRPTPAIEIASGRATLVVHEATYPSVDREKAVSRKHSTVDEAILDSRHAEMVVVYHLTLESEAEALRIHSREPKLIVPQDGSAIRIC